MFIPHISLTREQTAAFSFCCMFVWMPCYLFAYRRPVPILNYWFVSFVFFTLVRLFVTLTCVWGLSSYWSRWQGCSGRQRGRETWRSLLGRPMCSPSLAPWEQSMFMILLKGVSRSIKLISLGMFFRSLGLPSLYLQIILYGNTLFLLEMCPKMRQL